MFDFSEKESCGVGFIASRNIPPTHGMTLKVLECLANLDHRGAKFADGTGDGAGVLTEIPFELIKNNLNDNSDLKLTIAYEPTWAIGTGKTASIEHIEEIHTKVKSNLKEIMLEKSYL